MSCDTQKMVVRIDNILVTGKDDDQHLTTFNDMGAKVDKDKCVFFAPEVEYIIGFIIKNGLHTNLKKVKAILEIPEPKGAEKVFGRYEDLDLLLTFLKL